MLGAGRLKGRNGQLFLIRMHFHFGKMKKVQRSMVIISDDCTM